jgi:2-iminoacetate synthase ThiH
MSHEELIALIRACDPVAAAAALPPGRDVTVGRGPAPAEWLVDGDAERPVDEHRSAHACGRASEATVVYGEGVDPARVADRLLGLARLADETGLLRTVCPVPAAGTLTPGSWGVEDLTIIAAARTVLGLSVRVRPSWSRLGAQTCGVTLAFGADDLAVPEDDPTDVASLAEAVGRRAVPR